MKTIYSIPLYKSTSLTQLSHINNSIYGYDFEQLAFFEIDLKHSIVWTHTHQQTSSNHLLECKYLQNCHTSHSQTTQGYYCVYDKKISKTSFFQPISTSNNLNTSKNYQLPSTTLLTSNSIASFTGQIDAHQNTTIFVKLHQNHLKHSINWQEGQHQKKILKLIDYNPRSLHLNRHSPQILYTDLQNQLKCIDINKPTLQTTLLKKSILLFDNNYIYTTSSNLVSKFNDTYQIQTIDLTNGKSAFSFRGNGLPKKIQTYANNVFYMTDRGFSVYDKKKGDIVAQVGVNQDQRQRYGSEGGFDSLRQFGRGGGQRVNDFLLQPNLGKVYLSFTNELRVLDFNFF